MTAFSRTTRVLGFSAIVAMMLLTVLFLAVIPSSAGAVARDVPGTPMGPSGASGVLDVTTSPQGVYAVYLFAGHEVAFNASWSGYLYFGLYAPRSITVVDIAAVAWSAGWNDGEISNVIHYTPATSGVYYLGVFCPRDNGVTYAIAVQGTETMPLATTTTLSGPAKVRVRRTITISGKVSPAGTPGSVIIARTHLVGRKWKRAGSTTTLALANGAFSYKFRPTSKGKWRLVARYRTTTVGTTTYVASKSKVKNVTVK